MTVRLLRRIAVALLFVAFAAARSAAGANTLCVNQGGIGCFGTITAAINAAANGDTILIAGAAGPYLEPLTINKSLSLIGDSPATTIIDAGHGAQVIRISAGVTVTLSNLTIRNGQAGPGNDPNQWGGGIHSSAAALTLNNMVVTGNRTGGQNGCCGGSGGGIDIELGTFTLNHSTVSGNATASPNPNPLTGGIGGSGGIGGGINNDGGTLVLNDSTVSGNATGAGGAATGVGGAGGNGGTGGGIATTNGTVTLNRSTVSNNTTGDGGAGASARGNGGNGGGIFAQYAGLTLNDSTVSGNQTGAGSSSGSGAGLYAAGASFGRPSVAINTSTLSGNQTGRYLLTSTGGDGGAIYLTTFVTVTLTNATLAYNSMDDGQKGGGIANAGGSANLKNSLFAHNAPPQDPVNFIQDCSGTINSLGYNVMMEPDCTITPTTGDQSYVRGLIVAPLADNGGPTLTNALPPGSPAVDAADDSTCSPTDQRGLPRPVFGGLALRCDVGAFELFRFGARLPLLAR